MSNKKYIYRTMVIIMFILLVFTSKTIAQGMAGISWKGWGIRAGVSSDPDQGYGGIHFNLGEFAKDVRFRPNMELGFGDDQTIFQMLAEVHYVFSKVQTWQPYVGGGLGLTYINYDDTHHGDDSDTEISLHPIGGIETNINEGMKLFFELKLGPASNHPDMKFAVGISWK